MGLLSGALSIVIACLSGFSVYHSAQSIPKLQRYESKAQEAAKWSNTAERDLQKTRYTVGTGLVFGLLSLVGGLYRAIFAASHSGFLSVLSAVSISVAGFGAAAYMQDYWGGKRKIPFVGGFNDAITDTGNVMQHLNMLAAGWGVMAVLQLCGL